MVADRSLPMQHVFISLMVHLGEAQSCPILFTHCNKALGYREKARLVGTLLHERSVAECGSGSSLSVV